VGLRCKAAATSAPKSSVAICVSYLQGKRYEELSTGCLSCKGECAGLKEERLELVGGVPVVYEARHGWLGEW